MTDTIPTDAVPPRMPVSTPTLIDLERRIVKLSKINSALMQRVERSMDQQANAFSLFQTAIGLESQVRLRTEELTNVLLRLESANEELVAARDTAERANRIKTRFFTAVGHDLLQPLHAARLALSALTENDQPLATRRVAERIDHALSSVESILGTILDIAQLEAGVVRPVLRAVTLGDLFAALGNDLGPLALEKSLSLTWRDSSLLVLSDQLMLRRILQNLVVNAIRYTDHGRILIAARRRGDGVRIEVWDTGPGIPDAEQRRIFDEFQRGSSSERSSAGGFGLGLAIVKRTADALGHRVDVVSRLGQGTMFSVCAPFAGERLAAPARTPEPLAAEAYGFADASVLVVENDDTVREAMRGILERWSCRPHLVASVAEALGPQGESAARPDIILADYHLDDGERGLDVVRRVRERHGGALPAVVITADHSEAITAEARAAGCEILRKPVRPAELRALMQHMLGQAR